MGGPLRAARAAHRRSNSYGTGNGASALDECGTTATIARRTTGCWPLSVGLWNLVGLLSRAHSLLLLTVGCVEFSTTHLSVRIRAPSASSRRTTRPPRCRPPSAEASLGPILLCLGRIEGPGNLTFFAQRSVIPLPPSPARRRPAARTRPRRCGPRIRKPGDRRTDNRAAGAVPDGRAKQLGGLRRSPERGSGGLVGAGGNDQADACPLNSRTNRDREATGRGSAPGAGKWKPSPANASEGLQVVQRRYPAQSSQEVDGFGLRRPGPCGAAVRSRSGPARPAPRWPWTRARGLC